MSSMYGGYDLAENNLVSAKDLPGSEHLDIPRCLKFLDEAAHQVKRQTCDWYTRYEANPAAFGNSKAYFRSRVLMTVMQRDFGIGYNRALMDRDDFFKDSRNLFIHGVIETQKGTCANLAPFYAAIARRLGYPWKLVCARQHVFARWDQPGERFNIECTSQGLVTHADEYYTQGQYQTEQKNLSRFGLLNSQTPEQENANFLANRGHCWRDNGKYRKAATAYAQAVQLDPTNLLTEYTLEKTLDHWHEWLAKIRPATFPELSVTFTPTSKIPDRLEKGMVLLRTVESLLTNGNLCERWWKPMRANIRPIDYPDRILARLNPNGDMTFEIKRDNLASA